jgi:hypothetical protein
MHHEEPGFGDCVSPAEAEALGTVSDGGATIATKHGPVGAAFPMPLRSPWRRWRPQPLRWPCGTFEARGSK